MSNQPLNILGALSPRTCQIGLLVLLGSAGGFAAPPREAGEPAKRTFRVIFRAWDGDPAGPNPVLVYLRTLDWRHPFSDLQVGEEIPTTKLKLHRFEAKFRKTRNGKKVDVSELTLVNVETKETAVLVLGQTKDISALRWPADIKPK